MNKLEQLYEGKAKKVFATEDPELVIVDYKDDATAFNGEKKGTIMGKGCLLYTSFRRGHGADHRIPGGRQERARPGGSGCARRHVQA